MPLKAASLAAARLLGKHFKAAEEKNTWLCMLQSGLVVLSDCHELLDSMIICVNLKARDEGSHNLDCVISSADTSPINTTSQF